jgi:hypothetical protein
MTSLISLLELFFGDKKFSYAFSAPESSDGL